MSWHEELKKGFRTAEELGPVLGWSDEETAKGAKVAERFPMMITPYYLSLIDPADPDGRTFLSVKDGGRHAGTNRK